MYLSYMLLRLNHLAVPQTGELAPGPTKIEAGNGIHNFGNHPTNVEIAEISKGVEP
jgi:hypothetical protein